MTFSLLVCVCLIIGSIIENEAAPNFVFVLSDDQGSYSTGLTNVQLRTPFINALAKDGVNFNEFYAYKYCSPSRYYAKIVLFVRQFL
jgi:hypothetical protein